MKTSYISIYLYWINRKRVSFIYNVIIVYPYNTRNCYWVMRGIAKSLEINPLLPGVETPRVYM